MAAALRSSFLCCESQAGPSRTMAGCRHTPTEQLVFFLTIRVIWVISYRAQTNDMPFGLTLPFVLERY